MPFPWSPHENCLFAQNQIIIFSYLNKTITTPPPIQRSQWAVRKGVKKTNIELVKLTILQNITIYMRGWIVVRKTMKIIVFIKLQSWKYDERVRIAKPVSCASLVCFASFVHLTLLTANIKLWIQLDSVDIVLWFSGLGWDGFDLLLGSMTSMKPPLPHLRWVQWNS